MAKSNSGGKISLPSLVKPFIAAETTLPEITVKSLILGIILAAIMAGANAYLGLFAGMTVSASIPAAVISMGVLKLFRRSNILENNVVQTCASAGEALAAGVIFTLPALILLGTWARFNYLQTAMIAAFGGILGVLFTVPLRRAIIIDQPLQFPEGVACAEVLKTGEKGGEGIKYVGWAALFSMAFKFCQTGLRWIAETAEGAHFLFGKKMMAYASANLSPALVGVGYIVGFNIAVLVFLGGILNWWVAIPLISAMQGGAPDGLTAAGYANQIWSDQTRFIGVGAMVIGGLWALIQMRKSVFSGIRSGLVAYRDKTHSAEISRLEKDIPMKWVLIAVMCSIVPIFLLFHLLMGKIGMSITMAVIMVIAGFLFSAVSGYMTGLVGSSNNPVSGVTIATILFASVLLLILFGGGGDIKGAAAAILIGGVVACAVAIAGDNLHDLKTGQILGATPWKLQLMLIIGTVVSSLIMAPVLNLLLEAYGIGPANAAHPDSLAAPQSTLMAAVSKGVFQGGLPWNMIVIGMVVAILIIILDLRLKKQESSFRTPVLALAIGIYLPFELGVPILAGGVIAALVKRKLNRIGTQEGEESSKSIEQHGLLISSGLITGEALVGILMAIPIVVSGKADVLAFLGVRDMMVPGLIILLILLLALYKFSTRGKNPGNGKS